MAKPYVCEFAVRFADIDHAGIVYYPVFYDYFHRVFEEFFRFHWGPRGYADLLNRERIGLPAVATSCEYVSPLRFGDTAVIEMQAARIGARSITCQYLVHRGSDDPRVLCARGEVTVAVVDLNEFKAVHCPPRVSELFATITSDG